MISHTIFKSTNNKGYIIQLNNVKTIILLRTYNNIYYVIITIKYSYLY